MLKIEGYRRIKLEILYKLTHNHTKSKFIQLKTSIF